MSGRENRLILGVPSKGRLMEETLALFEAAGLSIPRRDDERGYRGTLPALPDVEVEFLSAGEIARHLQSGRVQLGITGEDLIREQMADADERVEIAVPLGFGYADVVVAVPECWIDVETMQDLEEAAALFSAEHGRRMRVATKYLRLTRRFFAEAGVVSYRTVESLGATEGAPAAGVAEAIVDITSTGATLKANALKILKDGVILRSQANLVAVREAADDPVAREIKARLAAAIPQQRPQASAESPSSAERA